MEGEHSLLRPHTKVAETITKVVAADANNQKFVASSKKSIIKSTAGKLTTKLLESKLAKLIRPSNSRSSVPDEYDDLADLKGIDCSTKEDLVTTSSTEVMTISSSESSHSRLNLEPIKMQIMSYIKLLRKMSTNHP